jgi:hypothetical protein
MDCYPSKVVKIALAEVGYIEKATNSQLYDKTANPGFGNWSKYADEVFKMAPDFLNGPKNGYDWCTLFVIWCFIKAYGVENARRLLCAPKFSAAAGCIYAVDYFKRAGRFRTSPSIGDQIFFSDSNGEPCHTGIVYDYDDNYVYTVEGNTSSTSGVVANGGCVAKKSYLRSSSYIYGYGHPDFDKEPTYIATRRDCTLYNRDYKDPVGKSAVAFKVPKGVKLKWLYDDMWGWSQVDYNGSKLWTLNSNLKKSGLSHLKYVVLRSNRRARVVIGGDKLTKLPRTIPKGTTVEIICSITHGDYKGYKLIKVDGKKYYLKSAKTE